MRQQLGAEGCLRPCAGSAAIDSTAVSLRHNLNAAMRAAVVGCGSSGPRPGQPATVRPAPHGSGSTECDSQSAASQARVRSHARTGMLCSLQLPCAVCACRDPLAPRRVGRGVARSRVRRARDGSLAWPAVNPGQIRRTHTCTTTPRACCGSRLSRDPFNAGGSISRVDRALDRVIELYRVHVEVCLSTLSSIECARFGSDHARVHAQRMCMQICCSMHRYLDSRLIHRTRCSISISRL